MVNDLQGTAAMKSVANAVSGGGNSEAAVLLSVTEILSDLRSDRLQKAGKTATNPADLAKEQTMDNIDRRLGIAMKLIQGAQGSEMMKRAVEKAEKIAEDCMDELGNLM